MRFVLLQLTSDHTSFGDTTATFLAERAPVDEPRRGSDDATGSDAGSARRGAELGWRSLHVAGLLRECVPLHGSIGVPFGHDLPLCLRGHTVNRALCRTPAPDRERLTALVEQQEDAT